MTLFRYNYEDSSLSKRERVILISILCVVGVFTIFDVIEDWFDGSPISHIIPEVLVIFVTVGVSLFLLRNLLINRKTLIEAAQNDTARIKEEATAWKDKASSLSKGISDAIAAQFEQWGLSPAEKEIGFLLLKGLSLSEISEVRETSERTIRQQASEVYKKSGLSGRAQLAAFFMEDLFDR